MRLDLLMLKDNVDIIMELNNEKNREAALFQILENYYCASLKNSNTRIK